MITLKDFLELDSCICGVDIDIRDSGCNLREIHRFGVGAWPGNQRDYVEENVYRECSNPREILIYLHPDPINFVQTDKPYRGLCRPWGIEWKAFPKKLLMMEVRGIRPFSSAFRGRQINGSYYSIDLISPGDTLAVDVEELLQKGTEIDDKLDLLADNMTIYEYLGMEGENNEFTDEG